METCAGLSWKGDKSLQAGPIILRPTSMTALTTKLRDYFHVSCKII
ncbi:unnamed protein product [Gulo gulo]|uniref:Uncharacterized protein n=1 Tax=Gulo gulo TaxID=48420 RepID=A0A9X9MBW9_GULGU|nr:unnamed protein product [Gulo gulo]